MVHQKPGDVVFKTSWPPVRPTGKYAEAEAIYRQSLAANKDNVEALNNLAWQLALRDQKSEESLALVDRAIDIAGPNPALLDTRAVVLMQLSRADKALEDILQAVSSDPDKPVRYFHLRAYHMTNAPVEARKVPDWSECSGLKKRPYIPWNGRRIASCTRKLPSADSPGPTPLPHQWGGNRPPAPIRRVSTEEFPEKKARCPYTSVTVVFRKGSRRQDRHRSARIHEHSSRTERTVLGPEVSHVGPLIFLSEVHHEKQRIQGLDRGGRARPAREPGLVKSGPCR